MRGISMYDSSSVSTLFSSLGSSKSTGSGLFGINLSEYASIRSGSYGKLMRSYFSMDSTKGTSKSDDSTKNTIEDLATTTSTSKDSTKTLAAIESDAKELTDSAKALYTRSNNKVFTKDSGGSYDTDKIYKAVKRFADDYNSMLDTAGKSSTNRISRSVSSMKNETSYNEKLLKGNRRLRSNEKTSSCRWMRQFFKSADADEKKEPVQWNRFLRIQCGNKGSHDKYCRYFDCVSIRGNGITRFNQFSVRISLPCVTAQSEIR